MTHDEFVNRVNKQKPDIIILGKHTSTNNRIKCKCRICGYEWEPRESKLLHGNTKCPSCSRVAGKYNKPYRQDEYKDAIKAKTHHVKIIAGKYENNKSIMTAECEVCGYTWDTVYASLLYGTTCEKCRNKSGHRNTKKTHEEFLNDLATVNSSIEILSKYENAVTHIDCRCKVCGYEWKSVPRNLLSGFGCKKCGSKRSADKQRNSRETVVSRIKAVSPQIELIGEYVTSKTPVKCLCNICGEEWMGIPCNLYKGEGCPHCAESHGEKRIRKFLDEYSINYTQQKRFDNLVGINGGSLSYDFFLPDYNTLIEFQGIQHESPVSQFGGSEYFLTQQEHDRRKREYAKDNDYNLIEIWYKDENEIEIILKNNLSIIIPVTITA